MDVAFTGVPVSDIEKATDFFERLLGRPGDIVVAADEVMWHLADAAWMYVVVDARRAGHGLAALAVTDLGATLAELGSRGVRAEVVEDVEGAGRKATLHDPDGNAVALIEVH